MKYTDRDTCTGVPTLFGAPGLVMGYFDGNTVTALWNYAQNDATSDNYFDPHFGPSTPGALNLIAGNTDGGFTVNPTTGVTGSDPGRSGRPTGPTVGTVYGDLDPAFDECSNGSHTSKSPVGEMTGKNIGDLLNPPRSPGAGSRAASRRPVRRTASRSAAPAQNIGKNEVQDYVPHHDPSSTTSRRRTRST